MKMAQRFFQRIKTVTLISVILISVFSYAGTFTLDQEPMPAGQGLIFGSMNFGDFDNDNDLDMLITGNDGHNTYMFKIYRNDAGTMVLDQEPMGAGLGLDTSISAFGDYDNDGDLDLIISGFDGSTDRCYTYLNNSGTFVKDQEPLGAGVGPSNGIIAFEDYDRDGDLDLVICGSLGFFSNIFVFYKNENGTFVYDQEPMGVGVGIWNGDMVFGDFNNDGYPDIAVTGNQDPSGDDVFLIFTNNNGTFTQTQQPLGAGDGPDGSIACGDFDQDGDLDLAVTGSDKSGDKRFIIFRNDTGTFTVDQEPMGANTGVAAHASIAAGDYDNDGDLDLAVTGYDSNSNMRFMIFSQDSSGNFILTDEPMGVDSGLWFSKITAGDYDNDGDLDLAVGGANKSGTKIFSFYKNGETTVNSPPSVPSGLSTSCVNGKWRFIWEPSADDFTSHENMRYHIYIGTSPGTYGYAYTALDYPRGQSNLGNVQTVYSTPYYQSEITASQTVYWKVMSIDTAFQCSSYTAEETDWAWAVAGNITDGTNPVEGVTLDVNKNGTSSPMDSAQSDASGNYTMYLESGATYILTPEKTHYTFSPVSRTYTDLSADFNGEDFTATLNNWSISGTITDGTNPIQNVTVNITGDSTASTVTDASGNFTFPALDAGGTYTVTPYLNHHSFSPSERNYTDLSGDITTADYTGTLHEWDISGTITDGTNPIQSVTINLTGDSTASTVTDSSGNFTFANLDAGCTYAVTPSKTHYTFTPLERSYTDLSAGVTDCDFAGTLHEWNISGTITDGTNPIQSVTVNITGDLTASTVTDASGNFAFASLDAGCTYTVTPVKTHYTFTPLERSYTDLSADVTDCDFTGSLHKWDISGTITDGTNPMENVTVNLTGDSTVSTVTDASGNFAFVASMQDVHRRSRPLKLTTLSHPLKDHTQISARVSRTAISPAHFTSGISAVR